MTHSPKMKINPIKLPSIASFSKKMQKLKTTHLSLKKITMSRNLKKKKKMSNFRVIKKTLKRSQERPNKFSKKKKKSPKRAKGILRKIPSRKRKGKLKGSISLTKNY